MCVLRDDRGLREFDTSSAMWACGQSTSCWGRDRECRGDKAWRPGSADNKRVDNPAGPEEEECEYIRTWGREHRHRPMGGDDSMAPGA